MKGWYIITIVMSLLVVSALIAYLLIRDLKRHEQRLEDARVRVRALKEQAGREAYNGWIPIKVTQEDIRRAAIAVERENNANLPKSS